MLPVAGHWASEHAVVVSPEQPNIVEWFGALLEAMDLNQYSVAAAQPGLAVDRLRDLQIPVPPDPEKHAIADFLDRETAGIDVLVAKVTEAIERLREYRTALISAVVTGRIDVRHAVVPVTLRDAMAVRFVRPPTAFVRHNAAQMATTRCDGTLTKGGYPTM